jgi:hypothetical protein
MKIKEKILSTYNKFPFGNSLGSFFKSHFISETAECYYLHHSPWEHEKYTTSTKELSKINYESKIIFWVMMDSLIDIETYDYYNQKEIKSLIELENICKLHQDKVFILLLPQHKLQKFVSVKNLFISDFLNLQFSENYIKCDKKSFNRHWITFNRHPSPHKLAIVSYLASKNIDQFGSINFECDYFLREKYNFFKYFRFQKETQKEIKMGFYRTQLGNIKNDNIPPFNPNVIENYNKNLLPIYEQSALEIICGSLFFEPTPFFSEKEVQSVYGKVFPIFINTYKSVSNWKEKFGIDVFEDVVDHSYDSIEDPTERLLSAVDLNIHLLNGTTDLKSLWLKNQERFEENCNKMDKILYDADFQQKIDEEKIKNALDYFEIKYTDVTVDGLSTIDAT